MSIFRTTTAKVGTCQTCNCQHKFVTVIQGNQTEVRLCDECLEKLDTARGFTEWRRKLNRKQPAPSK